MRIVDHGHWPALVERGREGIVFGRPGALLKQGSVCTFSHLEFMEGESDPNGA